MTIQQKLDKTVNDLLVSIYPYIHVRNYDAIKEITFLKGRSREVLSLTYYRDAGRDGPNIALSASLSDGIYLAVGWGRAVSVTILGPSLRG